MAARERVVVGIDLGTTHAAVARVGAQGVPEIIPNALGERTTPTVVYFEPGGPPLVGRAAKSMRGADVQRVSEFMKRAMGNASWLFSPEPDAGADDSYSPEELSALVLQQLKRDAERALGVAVTDAVITVPAYFRDDQRQATLHAGQLAGLNVLELINEPTAAALAYGFSRRGRQERYLVYDLGGGTFDVTLLELDGDAFRVVASDGDSRLGGKDFDDRLIAHLRARFRAVHGVDPGDEPAALGELRDQAEQLKVRLSELRSAKAQVTGRGRTLELEITRAEFEGLIADLVARTADLMAYTLHAAGWTWAEVDEVVLVGGSTRLPLVVEMLTRVTGKAPSRAINPDEAVALGAALRGWLALGEAVGPKPPPITVRDAAPHALGVVTVDAEGRRRNAIVVPKNTQIPCTVAMAFATAVDDQTHVMVQVTQGESPDPDACALVGDFVLGPLPPRPRSRERIRVAFSYDGNGAVQVAATDGESGVGVVCEIGGARRPAPEIVQQGRTRIAALARDEE